MTIFLHALSAIALVLTGAFVSGGLHLPPRTGSGNDTWGSSTQDALSRDLEALMTYGREEDTHEI